jgi:N-ethylmaleimide reductase
MLIIITTSSPWSRCNMTEKSLFQPYVLGDLALANRIVMAPLTRNRAGEGLVPSPLAATYYAQRLGRPDHCGSHPGLGPGPGLPGHPGLYTADRRLARRHRCGARQGGKIFVQLWHVGRVSHVSVQPAGAAPVAPSAIRAQTKTFVNNGFVMSEPAHWHWMKSRHCGKLPPGRRQRHGRRL